MVENENSMLVKYIEGKEVNIIVENGEAWFKGADVVRILGYAKPQNAFREHVELEDTRISGTLTNSGKRKVLFVNESGMYELIFGSKKPEAQGAV